MATITAQLTLTAAPGQVSTNALSLSESDDITVDGAPVTNLNRVSVATSADTELLAASHGNTYVYIKNTDSTNLVKLKTEANELFGVVWPGEWAYFCVLENEGLGVVANNAACVIEYSLYKRT